MSDILTAMAEAYSAEFNIGFDAEYQKVKADPAYAVNPTYVCERAMAAALRKAAEMMYDSGTRMQVLASAELKKIAEQAND